MAFLSMGLVMIRTVILLVLLAGAIGFSEWLDNQTVGAANIKIEVGPLMICPDDYQLGYFRKSGRKIDSYNTCYNESVSDLLESNKLKAFVRMLTMTGQFELAEQVLLEAADIDTNTWYVELVKINVRQKKWDRAQYYLNQTHVDKDEHLRLVVESRTNQFSNGINFSRVPAIFEASTYHIKGAVKQAEIKSTQGSGFELMRVDDAMPGVLAGETSLSVSEDGQNIWLLWTDSSGPVDVATGVPFWRLRSAQTTDGGSSWLNDDFSIHPEVDEKFHFDPMTAYDPVNKVMYAGGLTNQFTPPNDTSYYLKRWDLNTNLVSGPYETFVSSIDKDWLAVSQTGDVVMVEGFNNQNLRVSVDQGETFQDMFHGGQFFSPQPEFDSNDCLHIIGFLDFVRCDGQGGFESVVAPNTSLHLFDMDTYLPGSFRSIPLRLIAFHPNGDAFIIYPDLKTPQSDQIVLWMSRSVDGDNWQAPWIISPDVPGDRFLPWLEIDSTGGIHISYADTRNHVVPDNNPNVGVDMYYSYSNDLGQSWQEARVTPSTLMIPDLVWGDYFFSDYLEMSVGNANAVFMAFPWFDGTGDMDMYVAKKIVNDLIFFDGFE